MTLPLIWLTGAVVYVVLLPRVSLAATALGGAVAWTGFVVLPLVPVGVAQVGITALALRASRRDARRPPAHARRRRQPTASGTIGFLTLAGALVVVPGLGGSWVQGSRAAARLDRTGDLRPQRIDYADLQNWAGALLLPQVLCVEVDWLAQPEPETAPRGPAVISVAPTTSSSCTTSNVAGQSACMRVRWP